MRHVVDEIFLHLYEPELTKDNKNCVNEKEDYQQQNE
jgi:hypothetical protein